jgi:hypothetical protein
MLSDSLRALLKPSYPPQSPTLPQELRDEISLQILKELKALNGKVTFFVVLTVLALIAQVLL